MAEEKNKENKETVELSREYVINLRRNVIKAQKYRRAKKAILVLKQFLAKHMKVENRDVLKVKVDRYLNQEIWQRGIRKPLMRVKVKAVKKNGIVYAELAEIPDKVKFDMARDKKSQESAENIKKTIKEAEKKEESVEEKVEEAEKEKAVGEAEVKEQKLEAKQAKHESKPKQPKQQQIHRMALQK